MCISSSPISERCGLNRHPPSAAGGAKPSAADRRLTWYIRVQAAGDESAQPVIELTEQEIERTGAIRVGPMHGRRDRMAARGRAGQQRRRSSADIRAPPESQVCQQHGSFPAILRFLRGRRASIVVDFVEKLSEGTSEAERQSTTLIRAAALARKFVAVRGSQSGPGERPFKAPMIVSSNASVAAAGQAVRLLTPMAMLVPSRANRAAPACVINS